MTKKSKKPNYKPSDLPIYQKRLTLHSTEWIGNADVLNYLRSLDFVYAHYMIYGDYGSGKKSLLYSILEDKYGIKKSSYIPVKIDDLGIEFPCFRTLNSMEFSIYDLKNSDLHEIITYIFTLIENRIHNTTNFALVIHGSSRMQMEISNFIANWMKHKAEINKCQIFLVADSYTSIDLKLRQHFLCLPMQVEIDKDLLIPSADGSTLNRRGYAVHKFKEMIRKSTIGNIDMNLILSSCPIHILIRTIGEVYPTIYVDTDKINMVIDVLNNIRNGTKPFIHLQYLLNALSA